MSKIILYSSHCAACMMTENILKSKGVEFELVDDPDVYMPIAEESNVLTMPFASVDGQIMTAQELLALINKK